MKTASLRDFVEVKGRFHRSVRLNRDWEERGDLGELPPHAHRAGARNAHDVGARRTRGSLGPGRSPDPTAPASPRSRSSSRICWRTTHPGTPTGAELRRDLGLTNAPFVPVLVVGQRAPIKPALLKALAEGIESTRSCPGGRDLGGLRGER